MVYNYTAQDKAKIKANPLNRLNCLNMREITTYAYRDFQKAEQSVKAYAPGKQRKEAENNLQKVKDVYEERLNKFKLYKELFPDLVK